MWILCFDEPLQRRVLVCVDTSRASHNAVKWTCENLAREGDLVMLVHVVPKAETTPMPAVDEDWPHYLSAGADQKVHDALVSEVLQESEEDLLAQARKISESGFPVECAVILEQTYGPVADAISRMAQKVGAGVVVVASSNKGWMGRLFMGSVSSDLANRSPVRAVVVLHGLEADEPVSDPRPVPATS